MGPKAASRHRLLMSEPEYPGINGICLEISKNCVNDVKADENDKNIVEMKISNEWRIHEMKDLCEG